MNLALTINSSFINEKDSLEIVNPNESITIDNPYMDGYRFIEWNISDGNNNYSIDAFSFDNINNSSLTLIPVYEKIFITYNFQTDSELCNINNISHNGKVWIKDCLTFEIKLDSSVSESNINISSTNGNIEFYKDKNAYIVSVSKFNSDFVINITGIVVNEYNVVFYNQDSAINETFKHGELLSFPTISNEGCRLVGFKDLEGRYYSEEFAITSDLVLYAVWEELSFKIEFPKTNGKFVINYNNEYLSSSKTVNKKYGQSIEFKVNLSNAYSNSNILVYAETDGEIIYPVKIQSTYKFENINSDMRICVDNVELNFYSVIIDDVNYGNFYYGSWIYVDDNEIKIKDSESGNIVKVKSLINDSSFSGWKCNNQILGNCIVQDVANISSQIVINGIYNKKVARLHFITNGGVLDKLEMIIVDGEEFVLPTPTKQDYTFVGWYTKLVEVNMKIDEVLSEKFTEIKNCYMILYAGWEK